MYTRKRIIKISLLLPHYNATIHFSLTDSTVFHPHGADFNLVFRIVTVVSIIKSVVTSI